MTFKSLPLLFFWSIFNLQAQIIPKVSIESLFDSKANFRAIEVLNDSTLWFANSNGEVGQITLNGKDNYYTFTDTIKKHFRAISSTEHNLFALTIGNPARLYKFTKNNFDKPGTLVYTEKHPKVFYDAMLFLDNKRGIAMGDPTGTCLSVLITDDGGNSWIKKPCKDLPKSFEGEAAFAASNSNITSFKNNVWIATGGLKSRIFISKNRGKQFKVYNTPFIQGKPTTGIYTIAFYKNMNGIICGGDYTDKKARLNNKAISSDGGKTWKVVSNNKLPGYISCVQYVPNTKGRKLIAVSTEGIYFSDDKGLNWHKLSSEGFYTVRFSGKNMAFLGGYGKISILKLDYEN
jgi:photosystem II stability/assembly factor-like uncharacterized protein